MEIQLKKGIIEVAVLAALAGGDSYGYKIVQDLKPIADISESTLYPILRRLQAAGCLDIYAKEHSGRLRKYYLLTSKGREKLSEFLDDWTQINQIYEFIKSAMP